MHIYHAPEVTLLARQQYLGAPHINWKSDSDIAAEEVTEFAGRLCYLSFGENAGIVGHQSIKGRSTNEEYLENILKVRHGSVLEHGVWTMLFEGVSRSLTHELVRHRTLSYSQLSQRYVDESEVSFVKPPEIAVKSEEYILWRASCGRTLDDYKLLLQKVSDNIQNEPSVTMKKKRARQTARSLLPNCTETKIVVTGNARSFRHFLEQRGAPGADREIRSLAVQVLQILQIESPSIFGDYTIQDHHDGTPIIVNTHIKV